MGPDGVAVDAVVQVLGHRHDLPVGLQVGHQVKVVKTFGQDHHHVGVFLLGYGGRGRGVAVGLGGGFGGGLVGVAFRLDDGVHHQPGGLDGAGQVAVGVVGVLPGPAVGGFGLEGEGGEIPHIQDRKDPRRAAGPPAQAPAPADARRLAAAAGQKMLDHRDDQHRQKQRPDGDDLPGDAQGVAAHHLGRRRDVQNVLGHQGGAVQVAGVVVHQRQQGEHQPGHPGGHAPPPDEGEEQKSQAEGGQRVERRVDRPLPGQKVRRHAVGQLQLVAGDEGGCHRQRKGQELAQPEIPAAKGLDKLLHGS